MSISCFHPDECLWQGSSASMGREANAALVDAVSNPVEGRAMAQGPQTMLSCEFFRLRYPMANALHDGAHRARPQAAARAATLA
jgi:hypothetical protein